MSAPPTDGGLRVLHVEDDRVSALLFAEMLRGAPDIELRGAESSAEALTLAATWRPGVLVIDAMLPDGCGLALLAQLRALAGLAEVPAALCSADDDPELRRRAAAAGFNAVWSKPVTLRDLPTDVAALALVPVNGPVADRIAAYVDNPAP